MGGIWFEGNGRCLEVGLEPEEAARTWSNSGLQLPRPTVLGRIFNLPTLRGGATRGEVSVVFCGRVDLLPCMNYKFGGI